MESFQDPNVVDAVDALYEAYFDADTEGMLATMAAGVEIRFLGRTPVTGIDDARRFFVGNNASLQDLDFRILRTIIDGEWVAVVWDETATVHGKPYANHGVDIFRVVDGSISVLRVNNDITVRRRAFSEDEQPKMRG